MAQRIRFRVTAAKVGVSMALLALAGGLVEKLRSAPSQLNITRASSPGSSGKSGGVSQKIRVEVQKLEQKMATLESKLGQLEGKLGQVDSAVHSTEHKLATDYLTAQKIDSTFLKSRQADALFLKSATAASTYLKIATAGNEFIQGQGGVASAAIPSLPAGKPTQLLTSPDKTLVVSLINDGNALEVEIDNTTGELLPAVQSQDDQAPESVNLKPGKNAISLTNPTAVHRLELQTFGDSSSRAAITLVLSSEPSSSNAKAPQVVAQILLGVL